MTFVASTMTAMVAKLQEAPAVAPVVGRVRLRPLSATTTTAVVVRPHQAEVQGDELATGYPISWRASYVVECYARSLSSTSPDAAVDSLVAAVYERLLTDPTLGGVVIQMQPQSIAYDFDVDGEQTTCAVLSFSALHRTVGATL